MGELILAEEFDNGNLRKKTEYESGSKKRVTEYLPAEVRVHEYDNSGKVVSTKIKTLVAHADEKIIRLM